MFGNGVGTLRVIMYDVDRDEDRTLWSLSGEAGNAWYQGQVPISSFSPFKVSLLFYPGKSVLLPC